jgi:thiamine monophosphate synthase
MVGDGFTQQRLAGGIAVVQLRDRQRAQRAFQHAAP